MKKKLKIALLAAGLLLSVSLAVAWQNLSSIVKSGIETLGPELTKCPITVGSVSLSPLTGSGTVRDLVVGNPEGFKTAHALRLGKVHVEVDLRSLLADTLVVKEIRIEAPDIVYEVGLGSSNIGTLRKNLAQASGKSRPGPKACRKIRIDHIVVKDGRISLSAGFLGGNALPIPLPEVEMRDIGKADGGAGVAEAVAVFFAHLASNVAGAAKDGGKLIQDGASGLLDGLGGLFRKE